jgi:hypothetical protein
MAGFKKLSPSAGNRPLALFSGTPGCFNDLFIEIEPKMVDIE